MQVNTPLGMIEAKKINNGIAIELNGEPVATVDYLESEGNILLVGVDKNFEFKYEAVLAEKK